MNDVFRIWLGLQSSSLGGWQAYKLLFDKEDERLAARYSPVSSKCAESNLDASSRGSMPVIQGHA